MSKIPKLTDEQRYELEKQAKAMPVFPETDQNGKPIIKSRWFEGHLLKKMIEKKVIRGININGKIIPNKKYGPYHGYIDRQPLKVLITAHARKGPIGIVEVFERYMKEYRLFIAWRLKYNTEKVNIKNINNESTKKIEPGTPSHVNSGDEFNNGDL